MINEKVIGAWNFAKEVTGRIFMVTFSVRKSGFFALPWAETSTGQANTVGSRDSLRRKGSHFCINVLNNSQLLRYPEKGEIGSW
jgi:hypothetical protein